MRWTSQCALLGVSAVRIASAAIAQDRPNGNGNGSGIKVSTDRHEMSAERRNQALTILVSLPPS